MNNRVYLDNHAWLGDSSCGDVELVPPLKAEVTPAAATPVPTIVAASFRAPAKHRTGGDAPTCPGTEVGAHYSNHGDTYCDSDADIRSNTHAYTMSVT